MRSLLPIRETVYVLRLSDDRIILENTGRDKIAQSRYFPRMDNMVDLTVQTRSAPDHPECYVSASVFERFLGISNPFLQLVGLQEAVAGMETDEMADASNETRDHLIMNSDDPDSPWVSVRAVCKAVQDFLPTCPSKLVKPVIGRIELLRHATEHMAVPLFARSPDTSSILENGVMVLRDTVTKSKTLTSVTEGMMVSSSLTGDTKFYLVKVFDKSTVLFAVAVYADPAAVPLISLASKGEYPVHKVHLQPGKSVYGTLLMVSNLIRHYDNTERKKS